MCRLRLESSSDPCWPAGDRSIGFTYTTAVYPIRPKMCAQAAVHMTRCNLPGILPRDQRLSDCQFRTTRMARLSNERILCINSRRLPEVLQLLLLGLLVHSLGHLSRLVMVMVMDLHQDGIYKYVMRRRYRSGPAHHGHFRTAHGQATAVTAFSIRKSNRTWWQQTVMSAANKILVSYLAI